MQNVEHIYLTRMYARWDKAGKTDDLDSVIVTETEMCEFFDF